MRNPVAGRVRVGGLLRRAATGTGLDEVRHLQHEVELLEEAVAENRGLEAPLAVQVTALERSLVPLLEARLARLPAAHRPDRT